MSLQIGQQLGSYEITSLIGKGGMWKISTAGGEQPRWRRDGKELFYAADGKITAVTVKAAPGPNLLFEPGVPVPLFDSHIVRPGATVDNFFQYNVTADGKRFLVLTNNLAGAAAPLTVVVNWNAGLKK